MRMPTLYIPHGGGPCFFMDPMPGLAPDAWDSMAEYLRGIGNSLPRRPQAIVVVSAHWEAPRPVVGTAARHALLYDYYGFPEHTYQLKYPAPGDPALAARVRALLAQAGIASEADAVRGLDHGVFIPFLLAFPQADIPIVPLSLQEGLDPAAHRHIGAALAPLRDEGVLIVGSGMSYHNMRGIFRPDSATHAASQRFDEWLAGAVAHADPARRAQALDNWQSAPAARECHPREEHLLPLMVCAGAAGEDAGWRPYADRLMGNAVCAVQFG